MPYSFKMFMLYSYDNNHHIRYNHVEAYCLFLLKESDSKVLLQ